MEAFEFREPRFVGRTAELDTLTRHLGEALSGRGRTLIVTGEPGMGKSRLVREFLRKHGEEGGCLVINGAALADSAHPFQLFSSALRETTAAPLFQETEFVSFSTVLALDGQGRVLACVTSKTGSDFEAGRLAKMISGVQDFVCDSFFKQTPEKKGGLDRLEYGDAKVLMERGDGFVICALFKGGENPEMREHLRRTVREMEALGGGEGGRTVYSLQSALTHLVDLRMKVRRDLERVNLDAERNRISGEILKALSRIADDKPLILALEDVHWADESSAFVFNYLCRNARREKMLVVATSRPRENSPIQGVVRGLLDDGMLTEIEVRELGVGLAADIVNDIFQENSIPRSFIEELSKRCEGNPLFLIETLRQMAADGAIASGGEGHHLAKEGFAIPGTAGEMVKRRLESLDPDAMAVAEYASCIGRVFEVNAALSIQSIRDGPLALKRLRDSGLLVKRGGKMEFAHELFREAIYGGIGERWRLAYHRALGEYYERAHADDLDAVLYDLASHFSRSACHEKAYDYCTRAAEKAEGAYAPEQAIAFFEASLRSLGTLREKPKGADPGRIRLRIGQDLQLIGQLDKAEASYRAVIEASSADGDKGLLADAYSGLGNVLCHKPEYETALDFSQKAIAIYKKRDDNIGVFKAMGSIGYVHYYRGEYDKAMECFDAQLALAEKDGDKLRVGRALSDMGGIYWDTGRYEEAMENNMRYLAIAEDLGDKHAMKDALSGIANVSFYQKDYALSLESYKRLVDLASDSNDLFMRGLGLIGLGATNEVLGNYVEAKACIRESLSLSRTMSYKQGIPYALIYLGRIDTSLGNYNEARKSLEEAVKIARATETVRSLNFALSTLANLNKRLNEYDAAAQNLEEAIRLARELDHKHVLCENLWQMADLRFNRGRYGDSEALNAEAESIATEVKRDQIIFNCRILSLKLLALTDKWAAASSLRAMLESAKEDKEAATIHYEISLITGEESHRRAGHELFSKLYAKTPNILFKERAEELRSKGWEVEK
ncbi:MAG: tetratricopeptide repeat protein [Euryarchaeota archaeon]|nr:tetratricopeptide repeat protein [Euryarchaeota archaeon]